MVEKLRRGGIRSIDPVVDITNYVLLELGQPQHAYDLDTLEGELIVRMAEQGEKLTLLDGNEVTLTDNILVIADRRGALGMAGIFGGEHSGVSDTTKISCWKPHSLTRWLSPAVHVSMVCIPMLHTVLSAAWIRSYSVSRLSVPPV